MKTKKVKLSVKKGPIGARKRGNPISEVLGEKKECPGQNRRRSAAPGTSSKGELNSKVSERSPDKKRGNECWGKRALDMKQVEGC